MCTAEDLRRLLVDNSCKDGGEHSRALPRLHRHQARSYQSGTFTACKTLGRTSRLKIYLRRWALCPDRHPSCLETSRTVHTYVHTYVRYVRCTTFLLPSVKGGGRCTRVPHERGRRALILCTMQKQSRRICEQRGSSSPNVIRAELWRLLLGTHLS